MSDRPSDPSRYDLAALLDQVPDVDYQASDAVVLFSTRDRIHYTYLYSLFAHSMARRGIPVFFLYDFEPIRETFHNLEIDGIPLTNCLRAHSRFLHHHTPNPDSYYRWDTDLDARRIHVGGLDEVNLFPAFQATLRKENKLYNPDFRDQRNLRYLKEFLFTADLVLKYFSLLQDFARQWNQKVYLVGWDSSYVPHNLFYLFSRMDEIGEAVEYVELGTRYGSYFFGGIEHFGTRVGSLNCTRRGTTDGFKGQREEFDEFVDRLDEKPDRTSTLLSEIEDDFRNHIWKGLLPGKDLQRSRTGDRDGVREQITRYRNRGRRVFVLFAHVFYDVGLFDRGPFYGDMCEWIDGTLELFSEREDLLLLKPHPGELNAEDPSQDPNETLASYLGNPRDLPPNVLLLEPDQVSAQSLYEHLDCGLVWNSSVGMEMTYRGLPVIVSGKPYYGEYLDLNRVETREDYERWLSEPAPLQPDSKTRERTAKLYYFYKHNHHRPVPYINCVDYRDPQRMLDSIHWDRPALENFLEEGDPLLEDLLLEPMGREHKGGVDYLLDRLDRSRTGTKKRGTG